MRDNKNQGIQCKASTIENDDTITFCADPVLLINCSFGFVQQPAAAVTSWEFLQFFWRRSAIGQVRQIAGALAGAQQGFDFLRGHGWHADCTTPAPETFYEQAGLAVFPRVG